MNLPLLILSAAVFASSVYAVENHDDEPPTSRFVLGARANVQLSNESLIDHLAGYGLTGRLQLDQNREIGFGIDMLSQTLADPAGTLGLQESEGHSHPKGVLMANVLSVWGQQNFDLVFDRLQPFLLAGLGLASIDLEKHKGRLDDGTEFDLRTNAGTEHLFMAGGGVRSRLVGKLEFELAARGEYHLANWTLEDRVSGAYIAVSDYFSLATYAALGLKF